MDVRLLYLFSERKWTAWAPGTERALEQTAWAPGPERNAWAPGPERNEWAHGAERALERAPWAHRV